MIHESILLVQEFKRIGKNHKNALRRTSARVVLGSSVIRVFARGTKEKLRPSLESIDIDVLPRLTGQEAFKLWFERHLKELSKIIKQSNPNNNRIYPGYKWGHATKILTLYLREVVLNRRYFDDQEVKKISNWLYTPIDNVAIRHFNKLGMRLDFDSIKGIDSAQKFYSFQESLARAAARVGVPRVWFDDIWSERP